MLHTALGEPSLLTVNVYTVVIASVICSLVFFTLGLVFGALCLHCITVLHLHKSKGTLRSNPTSPTPVNVSPDARVTERKSKIELQDNVAYGPE